ncbi:uncharacterized protein FFUJ_00080 [Fusarium fujikuroi IMI 58289]|uniref:Uncharacterized protein n=1 Tax=Gibberella fujikuroi (strain CBS 195.34 / IMI 58289 / NRRL A-6831) TaxID=1279085 RepID=S0DPG1_GIBF5|nr:uncharacterized protein FFUJ_00080 [Fusarium fujikuroi IMI 58289]KLP08286.1 uncharacterized protein LW94_14188 [Fusarium fujikuroi]CCT63287.1 uncharacterized protein FFUJ_00080 [Fusarium fujikuroi IMI 58289]
MKTNIVVLIALDILPVLSKSTGDPENQIQCPSLLPNQHISRLHCKTADGSLIHVDGPGPFDCEISYVAIRPPTSIGSTNQDPEELTTNKPGHCELLLIKLTDDGLVQHGCCKGGTAVFVTQEHQVLQPVDPNNSMQKPIRHLQSDDQIIDEKLQTKSEEELKDGYDDEDDDDDDDEGTDKGEEDYDDDDIEEEDDEDEEEDEYGEEDYEDYGINEDIDDRDLFNSRARQEPEAQQNAESRDL